MTSIGWIEGALEATTYWVHRCTTLNLFSLRWPFCERIGQTDHSFLMKLPTILFLATLGLAGCKESKSGQSGQILPGEKKAVASPPPDQSVKMTPEQIASMRDLNDTKSANDGRQKMFPLEAPVRDLKEIAGGREVLLQFDGPPFWKRFSLTRNEWLPLPPMNLTDVHITGNATALFVLDRGAAEVRKFMLTDLKQVNSVKLSGEQIPVAILAGCNSERAPVHVLMKEEVLSLDPNSLLRRGLDCSREKRERSLIFDFSIKDKFQITGDA